MKYVMNWLIAGLLLCLAVGCSHASQSQSKKTALTEAQIAQANEAFAAQIVDAKTQEVATSEISCFFTSYYDTPEELDLAEFLKYFPYEEILSDADAEEFALLQALPDFPFKMEQAELTVARLPVPVHRYRAEDVTAVLQHYAGITRERLKKIDHVLYLEQYDAYYNFTSDYGPGLFVCAGGELDGDLIRFWSEPDEAGMVVVLTMKEQQGAYKIQSFQKLSQTDPSLLQNESDTKATP